MFAVSKTRRVFLSRSHAYVKRKPFGSDLDKNTKSATKMVKILICVYQRPIIGGDDMSASSTP
jgi:hypothetical protein